MPIVQKLASENNQLFDFCQQCECFHQAYYEQGQLQMFPCEYAISEPHIDEKIVSDTNLTSPTNQSTNSFSSMSINNHLSPTVRPRIVKSKQSSNIYLAQQPPPRPQVFSSKSPQSQSPVKNHQRATSVYPEQPSSSHIIVSKQTQTNLIAKLKPQQQKPFSFYNQTQVSPLVQKGYTCQNVGTKKTHLNPIQGSHITLLSPITYQQCTQTPQFGSQSRICENKQNSISSKRLIKQQRQFIIPSITESERFSNEDSDYFCCGYIRKCDK